MAVFYGRSAKQLMQISRNIYLKPQFVITRLERTGAVSNVIVNKRNYAKKSGPEDEENDKPVQFSTSEAAKWRAEYSRMGAKDDDSPPSQPFVVSLSLAVFLIYFLYLREENDIDIKLGGGGFGDTRTYLEYLQLNAIAEQNAKDGVEMDDAILTRLRELENLSSVSVNTV